MPGCGVCHESIADCPSCPWLSTRVTHGSATERPPRDAAVYQAETAQTWPSAVKPHPSPGMILTTVNIMCSHTALWVGRERQTGRNTETEPGGREGSYDFSEESTNPVPTRHTHVPTSSSQGGGAGYRQIEALPLSTDPKARMTSGPLGEGVSGRP